MSIKFLVASKTSSKNISSLFDYLQNYIEAFHLLTAMISEWFDCLLELSGDNNNNNNGGNNNNSNK